MKFGVVIFPTEYTISPTMLALEVENRGFESLVFPEHTHIPYSKNTTLPSGNELPKEYSHTFDPFVALSAAQAVTTKLKIGTGVALVIERDPIITAKEVATLDHLSGGRFLFGIGGGWNRDEMANHNVNPKTRMKLLEEYVAAMKSIWVNDEASFSGTYVNFDRIWSWPKPIQKPHPPILLGGNSPQAISRAARIADGWFPQAPPEIDSLRTAVAELAIACEQMDRRTIPISLFRAPPDKKYLAQLEDLGVERAIFSLASENETKVLQRLDELSALLSSI